MIVSNSLMNGNFVEFHLCTQGSAKLMAHGSIYSVQQGDLFMLSPSDGAMLLFSLSDEYKDEVMGIQAIEPLHESAYQMLELLIYFYQHKVFITHLTPEEVAKYVQDKNEYTTLQENIPQEESLRLWRRMLYESHQKVVYTQCLAWIYQHAKQEGHSEIQPVSKLTARFILATIHHANAVAQIDNFFTLLKTTKNALTRRVKLDLGCTPEHFLKQVVFEKSVSLMVLYDKDFRKVASQLQFANLKSFNAFFKRVSGMSPLEYMERHLGY